MMLSEYEKGLIKELIFEARTLNAAHLELFCDDTKNDKEKYNCYKLFASKSMDRITKIGEILQK